MTTHLDKTLKDNDRTALNFQRSEIELLLPEYFVEEYPDLIKILEAYYEFLNENGNFGQTIKDLYLNRDATQVPKAQLPFLEDELLLGQAYFGGFLNKREAIKFSNLLYRSKGTKYSIEQFFRGFFGQDPQVIYPKENIFKVGPSIDYNLSTVNDAGEQIKEPASELGPESRKYITDDKLYQVMSILIRVGVSVKDWIDVYKLFVHPAGVYLGSELLIEVVNTNTLSDVEQLEVGDPIEENLAIFAEAGLAFQGFVEQTKLVYTNIDKDTMQRQVTDQIVTNFGDYTFEDSAVLAATFDKILVPGIPTVDDNTDWPLMSQDSDGSIIFRITVDEYPYSTLFDSDNSADSAHYPYEHV